MVVFRDVHVRVPGPRHLQLYSPRQTRARYLEHREYCSLVRLSHAISVGAERSVVDGRPVEWALINQGKFVMNDLSNARCPVAQFLKCSFC